MNDVSNYYSGTGEHRERVRKILAKVDNLEKQNKIILEKLDKLIRKVERLEIKE